MNDYSGCFAETISGNLQILATKCDGDFASLISAALSAHPMPPPPKIPKASNALQGNLAEFVVWDMAERHWNLCSREFSWPANARSPWQPSSNPGIDIIAVVDVDSSPRILAIEVKSSRSSDGSALIFGHGSSLQNDFEKMYSGDVRTRLQNCIGTTVSDLKFHRKMESLAQTVLSIVGDKPCESPDVTMIGVLLCNHEGDHSRTRRAVAFSHLQSWLNCQGWQDNQIQFYCIELNDFQSWLTHVIEESINVS